MRRTPDTEFGRISEQAKAEAAQADVLAEIFSQLPTYFDRRRPVALLSPETVFLEHLDEPNEYWQWLSPVLFEYLRQDSEFNLLTGRSLVYRYVFLPVPELVTNWSRRRRLMKAILLTLHVHLWFGVICGIYFVNQQRVNVSELVAVANFLQLPRAKVLFDAPGFHSAASIDLRRINGATARTRPAEAWKRLGVDRQKPMWLFYDEDTYGEKLHSWRWQAYRRFFWRLYHPVRCFGCGVGLDKFALDHIAPHARKHPQTLVNFQPLCKECNSYKGEDEVDDPFVVQIILPEHLRTRQLDDIMRQRPPWLGYVRRPTEQSEILRVLT